MVLAHITQHFDGGSHEHPPPVKSRTRLAPIDGRVEVQRLLVACHQLVSQGGQDGLVVQESLDPEVVQVAAKGSTKAGESARIPTLGNLLSATQKPLITT